MAFVIYLRRSAIPSVRCMRPALPRSPLALLSFPVLALLLAGCGASAPAPAPGGESGGGTSAGADFYTIDGVSLTLDGACTSDAAGTLLADYEASTPDMEFENEINALLVLRFSAERADPSTDRATFGIRMTGQDLIADSFDGTTAQFQTDFAVVIGDGEITGSGTYLDWTSDAETNRRIEFRISCETAGQAVEGPATAPVDMCATLDGIELPATPELYEQVWDGGRDAGWVESGLGVEIASCSWHAEGVNDVLDVVQVTFLPNGHEWAEPEYYEHPPVNAALGETVEEIDGAFVQFFGGGTVNAVTFPVDGGVVRVGSTYMTFELEPFLAFAEEARDLVVAAL